MFDPLKNDNTQDIAALTEALALFTRTTRSLEEAHRHLASRLKEMDQELAAKNRELALTTEYLTSLLESMSDGVIAVDPTENITQFNRAASMILGFAAEEVIGQTFHEVFGRSFHLASLPREMELRAKDGHMITISERNSPIAGRNNQVIGHVKAFQDLTEIISLREQMRHVDRLAAIGEMAATVAHEIRNPLGGLRGFAALLARDIPADDPRSRLVEKIILGAESLDKVVSELLEFTRPVELRPQAVSCTAIVDHALGFLNMDGREIRVANRVDSSLKVLADPEKIRQVLLNVLLNAVQSMDHGEAIVWTEAEPRFVTFNVEDTGCGIADEHLAKIFSPFYTTKEKGTGLGLAVSLKIVESHGGSMKAMSKVGKGTTIAIRLPRAT